MHGLDSIVRFEASRADRAAAGSSTGSDCEVQVWRSPGEEIATTAIRH
jgi:hypothetical protein